MEKYVAITHYKLILTLMMSLQVFGWGVNSEGQCGPTQMSIIRDPEIIAELSNKGIKQISTG